ncbi:MAG: 2-C-methyl-D-erythritol 2,4-cyclodiphosphate synthase [Gammaproteobacteria bacterium]|jgi:2-C-methyl-D-erythritol 2,4-cyclodiphosphate synthase|nr:2-C-methyl-D-erythritol 2,4-cyclodiphosphate synthase [Gammaproteobacteria bacterium]
MSLRIGFGYDTHRFTDGDHIVIGGENILFSQGVDAHSDGDVLLHTICDALLGAAGLGDIGKHFPDTKAEFKDIESTLLLESVVSKIEKKNYVVGNVDSTVVLERPKLAEHISAMRENISKLLKISSDNVNIKATTNEGMSFIGRGEGVAAFAVVTLLQHGAS